MGEKGVVGLVFVVGVVGEVGVVLGLNMFNKNHFS